MRKLFIFSLIILGISACYAPPPRPPIKDGETVAILSAVTESHKANYRLSLTFVETAPPRLTAEGDDLLITFARRAILSTAAAKALKSSSFPCVYKGLEGAVLRFRCPKELVIYPETAKGYVDIIAQKKSVQKSE
jgi:hypothetical protein